MGILDKYKEHWEDWNSRTLILVSLFIQIILMFLGRWRKSSSSKLIQFFVWSTYLLANCIADFSLGFLSRIMVSSSASVLLAFWATFLFLHCGGPDTITAFAMEDNELWPRYLLGFVYEFIITCYVIFCFLPNNRVLTPIILVFLVAIIKNVERIYSLYYASSMVFQRSINTSLVRGKTKVENEKSILVDVHKTSFPTTKERTGALKVNEIFELYSASKPHFIGVRPLFTLPDDTLIRKGNGKEVLRVVDMELSYAFDELYTKASVNHCKLGYVRRALCSSCILLAFLLYILASKDNFNKLDVAITYVLLVATIFLDILAFIMLLFSNWMLASLLNAKMLANFTEFLAKHIARIKSFCIKKMYWSEEMPQLNLIVNCYKHSLSKTTPLQRMINWIKENLSLVDVTELYPPSDDSKQSDFSNISTDSNRDVSKIYSLSTLHASQELQEIIINHVLERICESCHVLDRTLSPSALDKIQDFPKSYDQLIQELSFDEQVFVWHIATELFFDWKSVKKNKTKIKMSLDMEACEALSKYMMHMVMMRPEMMSTMVRDIPSRFLKAYEDMVNFMKSNEDMTSSPKKNEIKSLFQIARVLYRMIFRIEDQEKKWKVLVLVWVNLMLKGVEKIKPSMLVRQYLSRGGDLIFFIWLLTKYNRISVESIIQDFMGNDLIMGRAQMLLSEIELHSQTDVEAGEVREVGGQAIEFPFQRIDGS